MQRSFAEIVPTIKRRDSYRLRCTGAPVVSANVLQWAPSRVTRRGALAATAAAAVAAFSPLCFATFLLRLLFPYAQTHAHVRPLLPLDAPRSSWSRGPLGTPTSPPWGPMVAWQAAFSSTKYTFPFTPERNGRDSLLSFSLFLFRSFCTFVDFVTLSFSSFVYPFVSDRDAHE